MISLRCFRSLTGQTTCRRYNGRPILSAYPVVSSRRFASTSTTLVPKERSVLLTRPTKEQLEEADLDLNVMGEDSVGVVITQRAAEHLQKISNRESDPKLALRIAVESGGCHGYQYKIELTSDQEPDDYIFSHPSTRPANIVVDAMSLALVNGATVDFATELIGSSFRISDNPQSKGNGCGCGRYACDVPGRLSQSVIIQLDNEEQNIIFWESYS